MIFFSERGRPLAWVMANEEFVTMARPVLTVELYCKWYDLQMIETSGRVRPIPFPEVPLDDGPIDGSERSSFVDHVPNPKAVVRYAKLHDLDVDELALELMIGRWELEVGHRYDALQEELGDR